MASIDFTYILVQFAVLILSLSVHEAAHAWSAERLGDPTGRLQGRVTLNPAAHVDPIGTILFPLLGMLSPVPVLGWAKPVPVNVLNLRHHWKQKFMVIAAAGPASNLVLAALAAVAYRAVGEIVDPDSMGFAVRFLTAMIQTNVVLAVFNMVPVPPLDGGNVLAGVLRGPVADLYERIRPFGFLILYGLMFSGMLWTLLLPPARLIMAALRVVAPNL